MVSNLAWAVQGWSGFAWECVHARGIGRRQVSCCCQWSTSQEVFPEHVGRRVTRADEIHLAVIMTGQHVELAGKKKSWQANTLSWPVKKWWQANTLSWPVKKMMIGQHVELASKEKKWWQANTLSWPVKKKRRGQHIELASKIYIKSKTADV